MMIEPDSISGIIRVASNLSLLLPLVAYIIRRKSASRAIHIIGAIVIVSGLSDFAGYALSKNQVSTAILFNSYYAVLFVMLTWFYYEVVFKQTRKLMMWTGVAVYLLSFILISVFVQAFSQYQTLMWLITAIIMIIYSITYFFYSLTAITTLGDSGYSLIWINIGVMIYFCMNLFLFVMANHVLTRLDSETSALIWSSHNINNVIKNILFSVGMLYPKRDLVR